MPRLHAMLSLCIAGALGCAGEASPSGLDQPLRVANAVFKSGELPGFDADDADRADGGIAVTAISTANRVVEARQAGKVINGRVSGGAYAVAVRFQKLGSGYWVKPTGVEDGTFPDELMFRLELDFGPELPPGTHIVQLVAIDADGNGGARSELELCVRAAYDDSLNSCKPEDPPAAALISLRWDSDADLDLVVVTPDGKTVDQRHPSTVEIEDEDQAQLALAEPGVGLLSADSNSDCARDTLRREDLVWQTEPEPGEYRVFANLASACGKPVTHFELAVYARERKGEAGAYTYRLKQITPVTYGEVLGQSANGGAATGLFVTAVEFPEIAAAD